MRFFGTTSSLFALFRAILAPEHPFVISNLRVEKASRNQSDLVDVTAVMSALVFSPEQASVNAAPAAGKAAGPAIPMGY